MSNNQIRSIMFADVSGSSALYKKLGNQEAKRHIDQAVAMMSSITEQHGGVVVKTIGDEVMSRFDSADQACSAAINIQQSCHQADSDLSIRIGIDHGPTLLDNNDVFGNTVNDAAFVAHVAQSEQIVITQAAVEALPPALRINCQEFDRIKIKGENERVLIYRLQWGGQTQNHSATTVMSIVDITQHLQENQLRIIFNDQAYDITPEQTPFIIGRDQRQAHLTINSDVASRDHCHILFRRGKYVLADHSTNGTYVTAPDQAEIYLRREELPLMGEGIIAIGQSSSQTDTLLIQYFL